MKVLSFIRDSLGGAVVVIGALVFQIGFRVMTDKMQENFAKGFVRRFLESVE